MASGHVNRTNRPNTWLHRPATRREDTPCQLGAVHTWHEAELPVHRGYVGSPLRSRPDVLVLSLSAFDPEQTFPGFGRRGLWLRAERSLACVSYWSPIRILPMTSKSAPLGWSTKNSPILTVGSRTILEMLRSWVIMTKFEGPRCFRISCKTLFIVQFGLTVRDYARGHQILNRQSRDQTQACRCPCSGNRGWSKPPQPQCRERGRPLRCAWPALHR